MNETMPASLDAAIAMQPAWLQAWVMVLVIVNLTAALFLVARQEGKFSVRVEALAILLSFFAAGAAMAAGIQRFCFSPRFAVSDSRSNASPRRTRVLTVSRGTPSRRATLRTGKSS